MPIPIHVRIGVAATFLLGLGSLLFYFQTHDSVLLSLIVFQGVPTVWLGVVVYHILAHGIVVRIVDERK